MVALVAFPHSHFQCLSDNRGTAAAARAFKTTKVQASGGREAAGRREA